MKNMKKCFSILLALVMVFALAATAMADAATGTITVSNAVVGQTYSIYRIFDLESFSPNTTTAPDGTATGGNFSYKVNSAWKGFFTAPAVGTEATNGRKYVDISETGYVTWKSGADAKAFAEDAKEYAKNFKVTTVASTKAVAKNDGDKTVALEFSNLPLGYYLMDSTLGVLCSLDTTDTDVTIKEKNEVPSIDKEVQEDSKEKEQNQGWGDYNDADIGQVVKFKTTVHAKKGAENYVVHDKMDNGLTLDATKIVVGSLTKDTDYELVLATDKDGEGKALLSDGCTFEIRFKKSYLDTITSDSGVDIVITYEATLNEEAVIAGQGNKNTTKLDYGDNQHTEWDTTTTYTWQGKVFKYTTGENDAELALANAKFKLWGGDDGTTAINFIRVKDKDGKDTNTYKVVAAGTKDAIMEITTDSTGKFDINGLDAGIYYLEESAAPNGYNQLAGKVKVTVSSKTGTSGLEQDNTVYVGYSKSENNGNGGYPSTGSTATDHVVKVLNNSGTELPETGGMGTTILYIAGGVLVAAAAVMLIVKRRMATEK